jgi:hypothetical protein
MAVKTIHVYAHHRDMSTFTFVNEDGTEHKIEGYAPRIKHLSGGDDTQFQIDNATGKIIGWVPLTDDDMEKILKEN